MKNQCNCKVKSVQYLKKEHSKYFFNQIYIYNSMMIILNNINKSHNTKNKNIYKRFLKNHFKIYKQKK